MANPRPGSRWDDDWRKVKLMDWLTTPPTERDPPSKQKLADSFGVDVRTMRDWQKNPGFLAEWRTRERTIVGNPDRQRAVMDTLYAAATDPANKSQVAAAKLYLEAINAIKAPAMEVTVKRTTELTDEELDELLAHGAAELRGETESVPDA